MKNRSAAPALFFVSAIAFFTAGGLMLRTGSNMGSAYFALGGAMVAIGAALMARMKKRGG
jgi:LPXTG-motif cell wall-anchored protein